MKTIYFIRHAKSSWDHFGISDKDRPLNDRGEQDAPRMAQLLKEKGVQPDQLVSSPAKRAFTTATYFAKAFDIPVSDIIIKEQIYEANVRDIMEVVREMSDDWEVVFLFGHNPTFTDVVNQFAQHSISNVPTCGICKVESQIAHWEAFDRHKGQLKGFYYPKQLFI